MVHFFFSLNSDENVDVNNVLISLLVIYELTQKIISEYILIY